MANEKRTATVNGYRWLVLAKTWGGFSAYAQKRCMGDNGKPYFRYCTQPKAEFSSMAEALRFVTAFQSHEWVTDVAA